MSAIKNGLQQVFVQWKLSLLLILWHLIWGMILSITLSPGLKNLFLRLPSSEGNTEPIGSIFMFEVIPFLGEDTVFRDGLLIVLILILVRFLFTPLINAGIYYSFVRKNNQFSSFFHGIRSKGLSYYGLGMIQFIVLSIIWGIWIYALIQFGMPILNVQSGAIIPTIITFFIGIFILLYLNLGFAMAKICLQNSDNLRWAIAEGFKITAKHFFILFRILVSISIVTIILSIILTIAFRSIDLPLAGALITHLIATLRVFSKLWNIHSQISLYKSLSS